MSHSGEFYSADHHHRDVFISYAQNDKPVADAACAKLESRHISCWIAPRDVFPAQEFPEAIINAIEESSIVVLIFSSHANSSPHVIRELTTAVNKSRIIVPFRIEEVMPSKSMEYLIAVPHWLDAITPPLDKHFEVLADTVEHILSTDTGKIICPLCKTPLSSNARFCEICGTPVSHGHPPPPDMPLPAVPEQIESPLQKPVSEPLPAEPLEELPSIKTARPAVVPVTALSRSAGKRIVIITGAVIILIVALYFSFPIISAMLSKPVTSQGSDMKMTPVPPTIDYRAENMPVIMVTLTTEPTYELPKDLQLFIIAEKNPINAEVTVRFNGGPGLGLVRDNRVILTRSDGTESEGKLNFNKRSSEITLQGTRGTDRLRVIITQYSGPTWTIIDELISYPPRGIL